MDRLTVPVFPRSLRLAAVATVSLLILFASVVDPPSSGPPAVFLGVPQDKWLHALAYAGLASTLAYAGVPESADRAGRVVALAFLLAVGYGVGIELVQATLPARAFDPADALANAVGAALGAVPWVGVRARPRD